MTSTGQSSGHPSADISGTTLGDIPGTGEGFAGLVGMEVTELGPDRVVLEWKVRPDLHQPYGILHGGVYCTAVETAASYGAAFWFGTRGNVVGVSNQTDFLRAVREGTLTATATPVHRGRLQQVWQVEIHDQDRRLVARGQVRLQNLENAEHLGR
jgi:1,4-dihydroxy-2-naphthoyl-CoA hydrolase